MNKENPGGIQSTVATYVRALRAVVAHLLPRGTYWRETYERMTATTVLPNPVRSVLFLCKGNICRSPLAEVYFVHKARKENQLIMVKSGGIETTPGKPAHNHARDVAKEQGLSLERHQTTPLYRELMQNVDLIFVMEVAQKYRLAKLYPMERQKVFVLGQFCSSGRLDIDDPYSGTPEDFRACFSRIKDACDRVIDDIVEQRQRFGAETSPGVKPDVQAG